MHHVGPSTNENKRADDRGFVVVVVVVDVLPLKILNDPRKY